MSALSLLALSIFGAFALGVGMAWLDDFLRRSDMRTQIQITDAMVAREFREQRCPGSAVDAITNPLIRMCLEMGARVRAEREAKEQPQHHRQYRDAKSRAANDLD